MTKDEALRMALEALEDRSSLMKWQEARDAVKEALAQPELTFDGLTPTEFALRELYEFQEATGCDTAAEFKAQPEQEPVAWLIADGEDLWATNEKNMMLDYPKSQVTPLYTTPPQRTWVGLTMNEMDDLNATSDVGTYNHIKAIEAKLKEKNA